MPTRACSAPCCCCSYAWYSYRALRTFYGQDRLRTLLEFLAIAGIYLLFGGVMLVGTALYSAATL